ncbi:DUF397 domain-containing protein [Streptomyces spectabilis]|uniref:DUF397 domain-containing protein n=1 Tax=Streptomyces spectabilis TaxID=68270 RepID=UPI0033E9D438
MEVNLYQLPTDGAKFERFCGGNLGGEHETCFSLAQIPGATGSFVIRDEKPEGAGQELRGTTTELDALVLGYARMRGLTIAS